MNAVITKLTAQIASNAEDLAIEEQYLKDINEAIANGLDVIAVPSKIIARIEYFKGRHMGLMNALYFIQEEAKVGA